MYTFSGEFSIKGRRLHSLGLRIVISHLTFLIIFTFFNYLLAEAADLKIEIMQIKDSGSSPFWSPDGKEIAFVDKGGLFIISADGSNKNRKIVNGILRVPRWSPDGEYISYVDREGLKIISPQGKHIKLIYPDNHVQMPIWSPDSKWIVFYLSELQGEKSSGVFTVNIETFQSKQLSYSGINPCWTGDGKSVFYFTDDKTQDSGQLFLADLNNNSIQKIAPMGGVCMNFNPERTLLAFASKRTDGTSRGIYLAPPLQNETPIKLSDDGYFPSFSPDSKWVSFFRYEPNIKNTKIYITPSKGGELIEIGNGIYPRWAFNKTALVYEMLSVKGGIYVARISERTVHSRNEKKHDN
ncbi:MAG: PD40 domain-containing protein [Nitrospirae bacterium]|nr:PD40 domain-containing protein [Nitrospirota bacterium]